jgi:hypothetical protein
VTTELATKVNDLLALDCIATVAERLQIANVICAAQTQGNDMVHRQGNLLPARRATAIRCIPFQNGLPFRSRAASFGRPLAGLIALVCHAVRFGMSRPIGADYLIASISVGFAPLGRKIIESFAVTSRIRPLSRLHAFRVLLAIALVAFTLSVRISLGVSALISRAALTALSLFAVRITSIWREFVYGFSNLALSASLEDNRHRSISITDWAMPRLLQQRVAFAFRVFYLRAPGTAR